MKQVDFQYGRSGASGKEGKGFYGGERGYGGCGETADCVNHTGTRKECRSYVNCDKYKGKDCPPNKDGHDGIRGSQKGNCLFIVIFYQTTSRYALHFV